MLSSLFQEIMTDVFRIITAPFPHGLLFICQCLDQSCDGMTD